MSLRRSAFSKLQCNSLQQIILQVVVWHASKSLLNPIQFHFHILTSIFLLCNKLSGTIDMDLITTGVSASERMRRETILSATRNIIMEKMQLGGPSMRLTEVCCLTSTVRRNIRSKLEALFLNIFQFSGSYWMS